MEDKNVPNKRILYVDPDIARQILVKRILQQAGHEVITCSQLVLANSRLVTDGPFDCVVCTGSVDEERSGDGLVFAIGLKDRGQRIITLTPTAVGLPGIPTMSLSSLTPQQVARELIILFR